MSEQKIAKILEKYGEMISGPNDLTGGKPPSALFYILASRLSYLLSSDPNDALSQNGVMCRKKLNPLLKRVGNHFLSTPQVFENRNYLADPSVFKVDPDPGIELPDTPVIWCANHAFKDDTLATMLAAKRHTYILFGSLPQFYNTFDGITAWINGVIMTNRKVAVSRQASVPKSIAAMRHGADLMVFPEGVWNKSPNALILDLWPGIYRIACETGAMVVPVIHYIRDCADKSKHNLIHTVVDDPVRIDDLSEQAALGYIRDILATWFYLMMEAYGKSTQEQELRGYASATQAWEQQLMDRVKTATRYDLEIELCADYRPKHKICPIDVWNSIATINKITAENLLHVAYAKSLIEQLKQEDFQHRF